MQDEVRDKSVALAIKVGKTGGKMTADLLKWAMRKYMTQAQNPKIHHGKQTVKQLVKQGQGVQNNQAWAAAIPMFETEDRRLAYLRRTMAPGVPSGEDELSKGRRPGR